MTPDERRAALESVAAEVRACTRCRLHTQRTQAVPGEGDPESEVVFVGEGPGFNEDRQGRPFVGAAGNLLNELLSAIGWRRRDVFITNVVKCRPPENRDPQPDEVAACAPFLRRQLEVLDPAVVVTLGRHSLGTFMPGARIGAAHGTQRRIDPATGAPAATGYAMYHPAAALRQGSLRQTMLEDISGLPQVLIDARRRRAERQAAEAEHVEGMTGAGDSPFVSEPAAAAAPAVRLEPAGPSLPAPADRPSLPAPANTPSLNAPPAGTLRPPAAPVGVSPGPADPDSQLELF